MPKVSPYVLLVLTTFFWAGNFVIGRAVNPYIPPIALSFWRTLLGLIIILPFALPHIKQQFHIMRRHAVIIITLGTLGVAGFNTFAYFALQSTTATNAVLLMSTTPIVIILMSFIVLRHTISLMQFIGVTISLAGVIFIVSHGHLENILGLSLNKGDLWMLAAVLDWALYSVLLRWRPAALHWLAFLGGLVLVGTLALTPLYLWELQHGMHWELSTPALLGIAYTAIFPLLVAYIFWNRAVHEVGANRAGQFLHLLPVFGTLFSSIFLGEKLFNYHYIGVGLVFTGIYFATLWRSSKA